MYFFICEVTLCLFLIADSLLNSPNDHNAEVVLQVKNEQSAGYDIIDLETHTLNPGFNLIHTSSDCKEVLNIPHTTEIKCWSTGTAVNSWNH